MTVIPLRRATLAGMALTIVVAVSGCSGEKAVGAPRMAATSSAAAVTPPASFAAADVLFAQMMIPHHKDAITVCELARTRAKNPGVLRLAEQIMKTQQAQFDTMVGWVQAAGKPTAAPDAEGAHGPGEHSVPGQVTFGTILAMRELTGGKFDRRFLTAMIPHHRGAIATARTEFTKGGSPEAKALARDVVSSQRTELRTMRKILAQLRST